MSRAVAIGLSLALFAGAIPGVAGLGSAEPAVKAAPAPATGEGVGQAAPSPDAAAPASDLDADVRLAAADFERGRQEFFKGKGSQKYKQAAAAFGAVIDRLSPRASSLDVPGRRLLAQALDYRAQASLLQGQDASADADYKLLVQTDPAYEPDSETTSRKILDRFRKIRAGLVATVTIDANPPEAEIFWNGRSLGTASELGSPRTVLAGLFVLKAHRACYEDKDIQGTLEAGESRIVKIRIDPSSRPIRFETVPEGFDVDLDGTLVGRTLVSPAADGGPSGPSEEPPGTRQNSGALVVPCVAAGEHPYTIRRDCYKTVTGAASVIVDFVDRDPLIIRVVPEKQIARLRVTSDVPGSTVTFEGSPLGPAPVENTTLCPGSGRLEVRASDRLLWSDRIDLVEGGVRIDAVARPTLRDVIVDTGPRRLAPAVASGIRSRIDAIAGFNHVSGGTESQLREIEGEETLRRGADPGRLDLAADLALLVDGSTSARGDFVRMRLTPALGGFLQNESCGVDDEACFDRFFSGLTSAWPVRSALTGAGFVETLDGKGVRIVSMQEPARGAGLREGDVIVSAGGNPVDGAGGLRRILDETAALPVVAETPSGRALPLVVQRGTVRVEIALPVALAAVVPQPSSASVPAARMLAVADFEASVLPAGERRNAALLTLASLLIGAGEPSRALALALDRPGWSENVPGAASSGTASFLAGLCHETLGERDRALSDYTKASTADTATLWTPDGLPVAPLARTKIKALTK